MIIIMIIMCSTTRFNTRTHTPHFRDFVGGGLGNPRRFRLYIYREGGGKVTTTTTIIIIIITIIMASPQPQEQTPPPGVIYIYVCIYYNYFFARGE